MKIAFQSKDVFSGIVVRSWCESWQARKTKSEGGCGHVMNTTLRVMRKPLDDHVSVQKHCNFLLFQHTCEQYGANLCRPHFQPEITFGFCTVIQRRKNPPRPRPCEAAPQEVQQPRITLVFQNLRHASTVKQICHGSTGGNSFGRARSELSRIVESFLRHIFQRRPPVEFWREQWAVSRHTWVGHIPTQRQRICGSFLRKAKSTEFRRAYTFQSCDLISALLSKF